MIKLKSIRVPKYAKSNHTEWHVVDRSNHQLVGFIRFQSSGNDYFYTAYVKDADEPASHLTLIRNHYKAKEIAS